MELLSLYLYDLKVNFFAHLPQSFGYFLSALALLALAKLARDITTRGVNDDEQITRYDNAAFGIYTAGYYLGAGLSFVGVFLGESPGFVEGLADVFLFGITGIVFLGMSYVISDRVYLRRFKVMDALVAGNKAVALFLAGRFIFSGLSTLAALHGEGDWFVCFVYFILGELGCLLAFKMYLLITPYDDLKALEHGNAAVGAVSGGVLTALGLLMLNAFWGDFLGYDVMFINFVIWFFGGLVLLMAFRFVGSRILFPKSKLVTEIYDDANLGAAAIMAAAYLVMATVIILSF